MSLTTLLIVLIVAIVVALILWPRGGPVESSGVRACSHCATVQPHHARFCRKCGRAL
jgi:hypothetical protein